MKVLKYLLLTLLMFAYCTMVEAATDAGWYNDGKGIMFLNSEGYPYVSSWKEFEGATYYIDENGYIVYNKAIVNNGYIYFLDVSGHKVSNAFVKVTDDMIGDTSITPGIFYFGHDGRAYSSNDGKFIKTIGDKKLAFDNQSHLITNGWLDQFGNVIEFKENILTDGVYYVGLDGTLANNTWYNFSDDIGSNVDLDANGVLDSYEDKNKLWMYFGSNCKKYVSKNNIVIDNAVYAFDANGILLTGFVRNEGDVDYNQMSNPIIDGNIKYYNKESGEMIPKHWFKDTVPENFGDLNGLSDTEYWFYCDENGVLAKNKVCAINGQKYIFDGFGRMRTGFIVSNGRGYYVADYKPEDLTKEDFVYSVEDGSELYGTELADLYYFNYTDDSNEGKMITGDAIINLSDGPYEFYFDASGHAIGKGRTKLYNDCYYTNGMKLKPWDKESYGIIKISDNEYRVVNSNGKLLKYDKKAVKLGDGSYLIIFNGKLAAYIEGTSDRGNMRWQTINGITGYYYYDASNSAYTDIFVQYGNRNLTDDMINSIPDNLKINFK